MQTFFRHVYTELVITLQADSSLGLLDGGGFIEDYFGNDNQVTFHNLDTNSRTAVFIAEDVEITPDTPHDVFTAVIDLSSIADGLYRVEGRARDIAGNYTIISDFSSPSGNEDFILMEILISPLGIVVFSPKIAEISLFEAPETALTVLEKPEASLLLTNDNYSMSILLKDEITVAFLTPERPTINFQLTPGMEMQVLDVYTL